MKKILSLVAISALALTGITALEQEAGAAADPASLSLTCTSNTTLVSSLSDEFPAGAPYVISALIGDDIDVTASGTSTDDDCDFANVSGNAALTITGGGTVEGGTSTAANELDVANSGAFTITPVTGDAVTVYVDACSLSGSGITSDPWLVGTAADFKSVGAESSTAGENSCSLAGHYLQTASLTGVDTSSVGDSDWIVDGVFTGTYDGDHYSISYFSGGGSATFQGRSPVFDELGSGGVIKRLNLTGHIKGDSTRNASLVEYLVGGTISEVRSSVWLEVEDSNALIGGLAAVTGSSSVVSDASSRIQYSKYSGRIDWVDDGTGDVEGPTIGGLVGMVVGTGTTELRDSYSLASISYDSGDLTGTDPDTAIYAGGLVGSDGETDLAAFNTDDGDRTFSASEVRIVRSYFAGSFSNLCEGSAADCNTDSPSHVFTGGLFGVSEDLDDADDLLVSAFWLSSSASNAVGEIVDAGTQPLDYTAATPALPEAPGLSATLLKTVSTFQSEEGSTTGSPSGDADLLVASSTGTLAEQDYRWAIESGNIQTFVPSDYTSEANYLTRQLFSDTSVSQSYRREGAGDLTVHGGDDPESVTGYPTLGRVWEVCSNSNSGYPFLVWEELDCSATGGGSDDDDDDESSESSAAALGLTEAEYLAFLASGLTLEQFKAARLAATGPSNETMALGFYSTVLLVGMGLVLLWGYRRQRAESS
ncbi:hypothetical protein C3B54_11710 [Pontimonas salivibrio]|uniref:Uncharacterized protein n=1 Tax=Pontimonas salivibrio TaxID=1159327 RepID=A0A2L2BQ09_9MICO|nr:hypothetical protein [Pontimonas salivibrio]AVG23692.1 hypothetical protein C3B54_11710 [Pontimonas salivibrio]